MVNYVFDSELAKEFGVNEAIMISNFQFWILKNKANGKNFKDGHYWTYNSLKAFEELFPFWSTQNIRTILKHLLNACVLITGNFSQNGCDRTVWYAFADEERWLGSHLLESTNAFVRTNKSLTDNNIHIQEKEIYKEKEGIYLDSFNKFWSVYPKDRAGNKQKAYQSFCKAIKEKRITEEGLLSAVKVYAQSDEVKRGFAKGCAAWLNDDRFNNNYGELKKSFSEMTESEKMASLRN